MSRRALFIGINQYNYITSLKGCNNDAIEMAQVLERNFDGSPNFDTQCFTTAEDTISHSFVIKKVKELFSGTLEVALFYFAGHGLFDVDMDTGYILPQDFNPNISNGIRINDIIQIAVNANNIQNKIIILDCCHSGAAGQIAELKGGASALAEGLTILTACKNEETAQEQGKTGHGVFTKLILEALLGGANNVLGNITPGSVYAFVDNALGSWEQRPVFKTNVSQFIYLRKTAPLVPLETLRRLPIWFPEPTSIYPLDPSYEPTDLSYNIINGEIFSQLQKCNRHSLVEPVDSEHMYFAAINSTGCKLTALGAYYRDLAERKRI